MQARQPQPVGNCLGQDPALVVAASDASSPVEGNRRHGIRLQRLKLRLGMFRPEQPHRFGKSIPSEVLHLQYRLPKDALVLAEPKGTFEVELLFTAMGAAVIGITEGAHGRGTTRTSLPCIGSQSAAAIVAEIALLIS